MSEFDILKRYFSFTPLPKSVVLGPGDDCAIVDISSRSRLVVTTDQLQEGVHFPEGLRSDHVAYRSFAANYSDILAMGLRAQWMTLALSIPEQDADWLAGFSQRLEGLCLEHNVGLIGGDLVRGPLSITITMMAASQERPMLLRSRAKIGDLIFTTGFLGDAAAGLDILQGKLHIENETQREHLTNRFLKPPIRAAEMTALRDFARAAIDLSDGLYSDLGHIARESNVAAVIELDRLPQSAALYGAVPDDSQRIPYILSGGDDYELCFTMSPDKEQALKNALPNARRVGYIERGAGVSLIRDGETVSYEASGYDHFSE